ncbi:hypothetical protein [Neotabrizicola sp. sgz301269]|uniref:hypothetical protein n=1 Tax=Neotabrizicola sp. sgz301269 TaxID=3276282 RepID=UPI0037705DD6
MAGDMRVSLLLEANAAQARAEVAGVRKELTGLSDDAIAAGRAGAASAEGTARAAQAQAEWGSIVQMARAELQPMVGEYYGLVAAIQQVPTAEEMGALTAQEAARAQDLLARQANELMARMQAAGVTVIHVYSAENAYLGFAPVRQKAGFFDMDEARAHARARRAWMNAERDRLEAHRRLTALEIGQSLDALEAAATPRVEAKVVRPSFGKAAAPEARASLSDGLREDELERARTAVVADLSTRRAPAEPEDGPRDRFRRALMLERDLEAGRAVTPEQQRWLSMFQTTSEYRSERRLWEDFGDAMFG